MRSSFLLKNSSTEKKLGKDLYEIDFQKLKALTEELKHDKDYATSEGLKEVNREKIDIKISCLMITQELSCQNIQVFQDLITLMQIILREQVVRWAYIASQGPLPNTVVDFWRMIWECEIQVIVMACNEQESGKYKCECYWPTDDEKKQYGNINVEFVGEMETSLSRFLVRTLKACWESEESHMPISLHNLARSRSTKFAIQPILELVRLIRDCQASEAVPVLVHCSAGCGRTGTICAIDFVWGLMRMGKLTKNFNLFNVIADMRRQRIAMVQTKEEDIYEDILDPPNEDSYIINEKSYHILNPKIEKFLFLLTLKLKEDQQLHESPKTSSPEDMRAGKLVGKATVIRRPSIAKLKALFEKSSQVSDGRDQSLISNQNTESSYNSSRDENRDVAERKIHHERNRNNAQTSTNFSYHEKSSENMKYDSNHDVTENRQRISEKNASSFTMNIKKSEQKKEKAPELPVKKKLPAPPPEAINKNLPESVVPRFQVNMNKGNQTYFEVVNKNSPSQKDTDLIKVRHQTDAPHKNATGSKNLHSNNQEYPEQGSARNIEINKQVLKPKSSLTDQTYPKFTYSCGKTASDDKLPFAYESTYMNVNSLAQKNIRQIEDKLKKSSSWSNH
ncbi:tyrosine-protein phosphatase non-receptor type 12 [Caerostris extrusa]|uniref:protein-tyrosine-phosphatase n=1 Tax=Caerostris extrusa TaxID=172846 RepID=A0AAV4WTX8_CAEEX|nr:tyrosine-protein phosphatase non-receptor type 12 [Caerostris extrusa]